MEEVFINDKRYTFIKDFKDKALFRKSYNTLTQKTYGFDFEQWYQSGYWGSGYMPYSLLDGENIVANVSSSIVDCLVLGETKRYIQIGTVMTDPDYQNQGLARYLMERVIEEWNSKCDMIYLFANDSVLDFYPKFGFTSVSEYQYSKTITNDNEVTVAEKLDMSLEDNRELVIDKINNSISMSKLTMMKNVGLVMFYCTSFMSDKVYYLSQQDVIAIAELQGDTLYLQDIFSLSAVDLDSVIKSLTNKEVNAVVLGFIPNDIDSYFVNLLEEDDTTLFVMKDKADLFKDNKLMFPILSHA
ncbi:GNAT family N-acetyltransferase [Clostridium algidicarnis]|uniref:GNAT family N-acetyltransferase n=1 Tax=Clostridium algidicarnis TaxID=37659 RepID=UPI0004972090|nr:GNAT family N-acetyltransferase [Clostridium algidicarnis]